MAVSLHLSRDAAQLRQGPSRQSGPEAQPRRLLCNQSPVLASQETCCALQIAFNPAKRPVANQKSCLGETQRGVGSLKTRSGLMRSPFRLEKKSLNQLKMRGRARETLARHLHDQPEVLPGLVFLQP